MKLKSPGVVEVTNSDGKVSEVKSDHIILATGSGDPADFFGMVNSLGYFKIARIDLK